MAAEGESSGACNCMLGNDVGGASTGPVELLRPQDRVVAETGDTPAEKPCEHFSLRGYVALVQKTDPKYCSLPQILHDRQQCDERRNRLCPFPVAKYRRWDCSKCSDKAKILDHRTSPGIISVRQSDQNDGCSISFLRSALVLASVDFQSLFPCTQQLSQGKNADRSILVKSTPEGPESNPTCNSHSMVEKKCNSHSGVAEMNTVLPMKDIPGPSENHDMAPNISKNAFVDVTLAEVSMKPNAQETRAHEVLTVDRDITNIPKSTSGQKSDKVCNSGRCEETTSRRSVRSNCKKNDKPTSEAGPSNAQNDKPTAEVGVSNAKNVKRKQVKLRLLSDLVNTDQASCSRSHENVGDLFEDDRWLDDVLPAGHETVGEIVSTTTKNKTKYKGVDVLDDESSLMNWMKRIPRKLRTEKKDSDHKDFGYSSANSKYSLELSMSKDTHNDVQSLAGKLMKKRKAPISNSQQGEKNSLDKNVQDTNNISQMECGNSTLRSLSKASKRKMLTTVNTQHDDFIPVSQQTLGEILTKIEKNKIKCKGLDVLEEESSIMNWMKKIPKKLRTEKKDSEHKDFDSSAVNAKSNTDRFASKEVHHDFVSSIGKCRKRKMLPTDNTQQGDENIQNINLESNMQNNDAITGIQSKNSSNRSLSKAKTMSLSERKTPSTVNVLHGDVNTENSTVKRALFRKDLCQIECGSSVQPHLAKVSPDKIELSKKRKKQKQLPMHEQQDTIDNIPMDVVELLARNQHERPAITGTDSSNRSRTQSKITEDEYCTVIAAKDGPTYASTELTTSRQKPSASESNQKALHDHVASIPQATSTNLLELQIAGHLNSTKEQQTHLYTGEVVTIAASSPVLSKDKDQSVAEAPGATLMRDPYQIDLRHSSSTATCGAQFRSSIEAIDVASSHVWGAYHNYPIEQPVIPSEDYYLNRVAKQLQSRTFPSTASNRAVNQVHSRTFPSKVLTMDEAGNLRDRRNAGQSGFYSEERMPNSNPLRLTDPSMPAGFPNYEGSYRTLLDFQLRHSYYTHDQYRGSTNTSHGSNVNENQYRGSTSISLESNINGNAPLTLDDLPRHRVQPKLQKPLRPRPRVGVLSSLLQKEIANLSDNSATNSGLKIGVSKGVPPLGIHRWENVDALNSGNFSARSTALQLGSVSCGANYLPVRNNIAQSWNTGRGKPTGPLDRFVRQDICVTNRNPSDITVITDDNEYTRKDLI